MVSIHAAMEDPKVAEGGGLFVEKTDYVHVRQWSIVHGSFNGILSSKTTAYNENINETRSRGTRIHPVSCRYCKLSRL